MRVYTVLEIVTEWNADKRPPILSAYDYYNSKLSGSLSYYADHGGSLAERALETKGDPWYVDYYHKEMSDCLINAKRHQMAREFIRKMQGDR